VTRGTAIILAVIALLAALAAWGLPVLKQKLLGESFSVKVEIVSVEEDDIPPLGMCTVVSMNIIFPIGNAPAKPQGNLFIRGENGAEVKMDWPQPVVEDNFDKGTTKWTLQDVYFPLNFRRGTLRNNVRDLASIWLPEPVINTERKGL
jgi:hypothetical protein